MEKLHASVFIQAPKEKVWHAMLDISTYEEWTKVFNPTSSFTGDWSKGSKMFFLGTDENGENEGGMVSRIVDNKPYEYISIEHLGIFKDGVEDTESEEAKKWAPSFENYSFIEKDGGTEVVVDQDIEEEHKPQFEKMWVEALAKVKELAEK